MFNINDADMKKIFLTGITAALISFAAVAQQPDSTQNPSNRYQQSDQQQNPAAVDPASTQYQQRDLQQQSSDQNQQEPSNQFNQDADQSRDSVNQNDMERGNHIQQNPEQSQEMQSAEPPREDNMNNQRKDQQGDATMNQMNDEFRSSVQGQATTAPDVEVVKDKEGPDNQVVYQYQGDLYYVDRDKKELVKAKESELQDARHEVIVDEGNANGNNNNDNSYNDQNNKNNDSNTNNDNNNSSRSDRK